MEVHLRICFLFNKLARISFLVASSIPAQVDKKDQANWFFHQTFSQYQSRNVRLCVYATFCVFTHLYKGQNPIDQFQNIPQGKVKKGHWSQIQLFLFRNGRKCGAENLCHTFAWTHNGICMDEQRNLHGRLYFNSCKSLVLFACVWGELNLGQIIHFALRFQKKYLFGVFFLRACDIP